MKKILLILLSGFIAVSCNNVDRGSGGAIEEETLDNASDIEDELMETHNEAMAKMPKAKTMMVELKDAWKSRPDSTKYQQTYRNLRQARKDMMDWMNNYEKPEGEGVTEQEIEQYLEQEARAVAAVNKMLEDGINNAQMLLGEQSGTEHSNSDHDSSKHHSGDHEGHDH